MNDIRLVFTKCDRAKYISHLDLMRVFTRAFARARLPVWYTEGFNPHVYLTFALPLSLGCESRVETMDIRLTQALTDAELTARLNAVLPEGIRILSVAPPQHKADEIRFCDYELCFKSETPLAVAEGIRAFYAQETLPVIKKTKRGERALDLKQYITPLGEELIERAFTVRLRLVSGLTENISTTLLLSAMQPFLPDADSFLTHITRTAVLLADLSAFR